MSLYAVKSFPNSDAVQTEARLARAVSNMCYMERGLFKAAVLVMLANEVWTIHKSSAIRIGRDEQGNLAGNGKREIVWQRERVTMDCRRGI